MKAKILNLVMLLGFVILSASMVAQTAIYVTPGSTHRVMCWADNGTTLDTECDVNLNGDFTGSNQDTIYVPTGQTFSMEAGIEDVQFASYMWQGLDNSYIWEIDYAGSWVVSKYSNSTARTYVGHFIVKYYDPVVMYDAIFTVTDGTNPISGATVSVTGEGSDVTNGSGICTFEDLEDGDYDYTVTASGYDAVNSSFTVSGSNVSMDVEMTETTAPVYVVNFHVQASSKNIVGATVTLTGYGDQVTDGSGNCSFTDIPDGTYAYSVTATDYQDASGSVTVSGGDVNETVYMDPLGLHDIHEIEMTVYPNPVTNYLTIAGVSNVQWAVYSITGQVVKSGEGGRISMNDLNTGYYMLKVITDEGSVVKKILKQ